ncbi:hypothetical protein [Zooshikella harenae]|uniref:Uncharacterized protein n=1 Tax=Zooshikella harenae TaxID=2827238 RepID=A0ABS5ZDJ1_9GAMM|nr:hypothetical protein [Zooshikella harenae]MBU2712055.1 hypothetical protein [Zooshikella harenae]
MSGQDQILYQKRFLSFDHCELESHQFTELNIPDQQIPRQRLIAKGKGIIEEDAIFEDEHNLSASEAEANALDNGEEEALNEVTEDYQFTATIDDTSEGDAAAWELTFKGKSPTFDDAYEILRTLLNCEDPLIDQHYNPTVINNESESSLTKSLLNSDYNPEER